MKSATKKQTILFLMMAVMAQSAATASKEVNWDDVLKKGNYMLQVGESEKAAEFFASKVKKYPSSAQCHTALGRAFKRMGKLDPAKTEFKTATEVDQNYADGFYELGVLQESDKEWALAADNFERYLTLRPDNGQRRAIEDRIKYCKGNCE